MSNEPLELYRRASEWTLGKIKGARGKMSASTPCDEWTVEQLLNHMLETQRYFLSAARGGDAPPPGPNPPTILSDDPVADFQHARSEMLNSYAGEGVIDKTGPALGIAFSDQLLHGWDIATATGQDARMPDDLAEAAHQMIHGRFTDEQRKGVFKPEIQVAADASPQEKLLAYTGRRATRG